MHVQGNISVDGEGELLFSGAAEHLKDYKPPVEDDHLKKRTQKLSPKRTLPKSSVKKSGPLPKKATQNPCPSSKQLPSKKRKTVSPAASPKKRADPSKKSTRGSPKKSSKEAPLRALANRLQKSSHKLLIPRPMTRELKSTLRYIFCINICMYMRSLACAHVYLGIKILDVRQ